MKWVGLLLVWALLMLVALGLGGMVMFAVLALIKQPVEAFAVLVVMGWAALALELSIGV